MALAGAGPTGAVAAGPPQVLAAWSAEVGSSSARLQAEVDPNGAFAYYRFEYLTEAAYQVNLGKGADGFAGAVTLPGGEGGPLGAAPGALTVSLQLSSLAPQTAYRYRVSAHNSAGTTDGAALSFITFGLSSSLLADGRGWEMVSPVEKNGGGVAVPGALFGGGLLQAAAGGGGIAFASATSFGPDAAGAPPGSQYLSRRSATGWSTADVSASLASGAYGSSPEGVPYQLFSADLARGLMLEPHRCAAGEACPRRYSLREGSVTLATSPTTDDLRFAGASADLRHVVLSTCRALSPDATEVTLGSGCDPQATNLYDWSGGALRLINLLPGQALGSPGARLAEAASSVSGDGSRVYFTLGGNLYLRQGAQTKQVDTAAGGGGKLLDATPDGSLAFYAKDGDLYRYDASPATSTALGVEGVEGPLDATPDGHRLAFVSTAPLTGYDNTDLLSGAADSEVYLSNGAGGDLDCVSCNPTGERPIGPSSIPAARPNGGESSSFGGHKPRALAVGGDRVFFDSADALVPADTNGAPDVYQWEAQGSGSCTGSGGCLSLVSSGRGEGGASFADASADGADAFFLTARSLVGGDPGSVDLYDARVGGGFPEPPASIACEGDACQVIPAEPGDPPLNTLVAGPGNPKPRYIKLKRETKKRPHRHRRHHNHGRGHR